MPVGSLNSLRTNVRKGVYGNIAKLYNEYTGYEDAEKQNLLFSGKCVGIMQRAGDGGRS